MRPIAATATTASKSVNLRIISFPRTGWAISRMSFFDGSRRNKRPSQRLAVAYQGRAGIRRRDSRPAPHASRLMPHAPRLKHPFPNILRTLNTLFASVFFFEKIVLSPIALIRSYGGGCILVSWGYWLYALHVNAIARVFLSIGTRIESGNREWTDNQSGER